MNMESMGGFARKQERESEEKKLNELTLAESNILQGKLAVLYFNKSQEEREAAGEQVKKISSIEKKDWTDEDKELFRQAFYEWADEKNTDRPSLSFNDYISNRFPEETIDINDSAAVHRLFEKIMINRGTGSLEQVVQQDLV